MLEAPGAPLPAPAAGSPVPPRLPCANCAGPDPGAFCAACGQRVYAARLTLGEVARRLVADAFDIDRGVLHTGAALFRRPGEVVRDFLRGRTVPYSNPVKYFLLVLAVVQLAALWGGATGQFVSGLTEGSPDGTVTRTAALLDRFFVLLAAPAVPVLAASHRLLFRRAGLTYGEHLVAALFVAAQQLLLWLPALTVAGAATGPARWLLPATSLAAAVGYHAWAARQTFGLAWPGALLRSAAALALSAVTYLAFLIVLALVARRV